MEPDDYTIDISTMADSSSITVSTVSPGSVWIDSNNISVYNGSDWVKNPCSEISINNVLFEDYLPDIKELERMCEEYPGLEKAYENFKTFYKLVEQDWRGKQKNKKS